MNPFKIAIGTQANSLELIKKVSEDKYLTYLAGPITFSDIVDNATMEQWNEYLCDNLVESGHLLMNMGYELKVIDKEVFIEVNADASEWVDEIRETYADKLEQAEIAERERELDEWESNGGFF